MLNGGVNALLTVKILVQMIEQRHKTWIVCEQLIILLDLLLIAFCYLSKSSANDLFLVIESTTDGSNHASSTNRLEKRKDASGSHVSDHRLDSSRHRSSGNSTTREAQDRKTRAKRTCNNTNNSNDGEEEEHSRSSRGKQ